MFPTANQKIFLLPIWLSLFCSHVLPRLLFYLPFTYQFVEPIGRLGLGIVSLNFLLCVFYMEHYLLYIFIISL